jgi:hypothetical protein
VDGQAGEEDMTWETKPEEEMDLHWCGSCHQWKPMDAFFPSAIARKGRPCKDCAREYQKNYMRKRGAVPRKKKNDPPANFTPSPEFLMKTMQALMSNSVEETRWTYKLIGLFLEHYDGSTKPSVQPQSQEETDQ